MRFRVTGQAAELLRVIDKNRKRLCKKFRAKKGLRGHEMKISVIS